MKGKNKSRYLRRRWLKRELKEEREFDIYREVWRTLPAFLCASALFAILLFAGGCSRRVYVPVENTVLHSDTVTRYINNTDSVTVIEHVYESDARYDSIAPILDSLGRVIGFDRWHFRQTIQNNSREMQRLQSLVDSLRAVKNDSIEKRVPYPVERKLTRWEQAKMDFGGIAIGGVAIVICIAVVWLASRKRIK